jgi:septum formation protein
LEEEEKNKKKKLKIILASSSPRRKSILEMLKLDFDIVVPSGVNEKVLKSPLATVINNSYAKAQWVYNNTVINNPGPPQALIAGFDTIIYMRGRYFGKPCDNAQAEQYLEALSGRTHRAITGITIIDPKSLKTVSGYEITGVEFNKLNKSFIKYYLEKESITDKAGAYDISGYGSIMVKKINGCFYNVAGLPVGKFLYLLGMLGYKLEDFYSF